MKWTHFLIYEENVETVDALHLWGDVTLRIAPKMLNTQASKHLPLKKLIISFPLFTSLDQQIHHSPQSHMMEPADLRSNLKHIAQGMGDECKQRHCIGSLELLVLQKWISTNTNHQNSTSVRALNWKIAFIHEATLFNTESSNHA